MAKKTKGALGLLWEDGWWWRKTGRNKIIRHPASKKIIAIFKENSLENTWSTKTKVSELLKKFTDKISNLFSTSEKEIIFNPYQIYEDCIYYLTLLSQPKDIDQKNNLNHIKKTMKEVQKIHACLIFSGEVIEQSENQNRDVRILHNLFQDQKRELLDQQFNLYEAVWRINHIIRKQDNIDELYKIRIKRLSKNIEEQYLHIINPTIAREGKQGKKNKSFSEFKKDLQEKFEKQRKWCDDFVATIPKAIVDPYG